VIGIRKAFGGGADEAGEVALIPALVRRTERFHVFRAYRKCLLSQKAQGRAGHVRTRPRARCVVLGGFLCSDFVGSGGMDIKGPNHGRSFEQVLYGLLHRVELFALVALGIFSRMPEAERKDTIRLRVGVVSPRL